MKSVSTLERRAVPEFRCRPVAKSTGISPSAATLVVPSGQAVTKETYSI